jgi:hypothetical protein
MAIKFLNSVIKPVKSSILKTDPDGVLVAAVAGTDYLSSISSSLVTTALGFTPVPTTRTITINGTALDLSANRSYTISTITGNAGTATTLQTARTLTIGSTGKTFNGSANVSWSLTEIGAAAMAHVHSAADITSGVLASARLSGTYGIAITGNAASANILSTSRTFTIGNTAKGFNGSGNVSWTLAEIGAIPSRSGIIKSGGIVDTTSLFPFSITTAQTAIGFEYNILLNAQKKGYTVTQSGTGQIGAPFNLFDGRLEPNYSGDGVNPADPFVLLIEGLPGTHTQTGGVFGWTCRYWVPTIYKVEAFDSYNNVGWKTLVDQQSPLATKDLVIPISQSGLAGGLTKFRITIYDSNGATGANGFRRWGISEIFFIHPEAQATHQFLDVEWAKKLSTARTIGGVSFDGSANINLPGVNTTGNQNTTGSAGTVTGSSTIDGYLTLNTNWGVSPYTSAFNIIGTYPSMTFRGSNGDTHYLIHMDSGGNIQYYFGPGHLTNNWTRRYEFTKGGNFSVLTGNISASGTVTASGGNSTQWNTAFGWGDHDGLYATTGYVDTAIANLVDTAPDALNTLNELSAALGDDPNFATTIATAIGGKADASHTHEISDINNLQTELDGKQPVGSYAAASHTHAISDVTGLQSALDGKQPTGSYAAASHTHDDRYYTESEIDSKLVAMTPFQTTSDFTQGTLIRTNINAAGTNGDSFLMQLVGKSYTTGATPFDMLLQGYIYNNTFISYSALVNSSDFPAEIVILEDGGNLCFWFARYTYWNSFEIKVTAVNGEDSTPDNRIVSVVNSAEPASAKKVRVIPIQSWNSADFSSSQISNWNTAYNWGNHAGLYAAASHTHAISNVTGLQTALDGKQAAGSYLTSLPAHTHDDRYYTESEVNSLLSSKANTSHKYHTFSAGNEYYDSYGQENNLRLFTENATFDNFRFRSYSNVEYFDGTNWVAWGQSLNTLFDGREETGISLGHANSHFRFEINRSSGWPTTALFVIQSSWTDTNSHTCEVTLETWNGSAWVQKDNWTYSNFQRGINLHTTTNVHDGNAQMRVTINMDWVDASHNYYPIRRILLLSNFSGSAYDMQPFTWDYGKNVTFASQIYVSGGNSSQWNTAYGWGNHDGLYAGIDTEQNLVDLTNSLGSAAYEASTAFAAASHTHTIAQVTGLQTALDEKLSLTGGTLTGQAIFPSAATTKPVLPNGFISRNDLSDTSGRHDIWGISERYYPSNTTAGDAWGIQWSGTPNDIVFVGGGTDRVTISLDEGNITSLGTVTASGGNSTQWNTAYGWGDHDGLYATTGYVDTAIANLVDTAPDALDTLNELAAALGDDPNFATTVTNSIATKAPLASPALTGTPTAPTASTATNSTQIATTAFVKNQGYITGVTNISGYSGTLLAEDNRTISPNELATVRLKFGFTSWANNNTAPYADFLHMRSYPDTSGGNDNLVMFLKSGIGMRIYQQAFGSATAYSTFKDVAFTDSSITGNAGSATVLQTARTLTIGNTGKSFNGSANVSWTLAEIGALGATAKAADSNLFDGIDSVNFVYGNAKGTNDSVTTNNDDLDKTGYYTSSDFATKPSGVPNWMYIEHIKLYNDNADYQKQIGYDTYGNRMWVRTKSAGAWSSWAEIWTSNTDGAGSGLDADTVDGIQAASFLRSDADDSFSGTLTMSTQRALVASNYGHGVYGIYSASRYQHVWSMGAGYDLPADGLSSGNGGSLYGLAWSYNPDYSYVGSNAQSKPGLNHQLLLMMNGVTHTALGTGIWTNGLITTVNHGTSANWNTAYGWGNHADYEYWNTGSVDAKNVQSAEVAFAGNVTVEGTFTESSSIRLKENITPLDPALDKVNQLEAVSYNKIGADDREVGLIAEDVAELFPEVVTYNEEGQPQGIQYQRLSVILLKAVQELTERVNKLENK